MTCQQAELGESAAGLLRRMLHTEPSPALHGELERIAASLPDAPAASLRQAAAHVAQHRWPSPHRFPVPAHPIEPSEDTNTALAEVPPSTPHDAKLADLPGQVIRTIWLREFHVHTPERVLGAARTRGWEPDPDELPDEDDPQDLLGAVLYLAEDSADIPGAHTLTDSSVSEHLRASQGDEVADWSTAPVTADFGRGWRLNEAIHTDLPKHGPTVETPFGDVPDFAVLFPTKTCSCDDEECDTCAWQLTPRTADLLHSALEVLSDHAHDDIENMGGTPVNPNTSAGWIFFDRLPHLTFRQDRHWRRQVAHACEDLAADLARGQWPEPTCTAEELVLHLAIEDAPSYLDLDDEDPDARHASLPKHRDDYDWDGCSDLLFQDHDVLMLYSNRFDGIEDPEGEANQHLGIGDLRAPAWFEPFGNVTPRSPERTFRR
ncbi:hypothetical protein ACFWJW_13915 [Streptomyces sp. NPDC127097]|uniref:hypothetical protein n=1 Tax=Streptomyces sp. NPDC127097 TaxID=3347136 RepID=UPI00364D6D62